MPSWMPITILTCHVGQPTRFDEFESIRYRGQKGPGLPGKVRGVIVEDHANSSLPGILGVRQAQKVDELGTPVAVAHQAQHLSAPEINTRQQRQRTVADVLRVAAQPGMLAGYRGQVRGGALQDLNPRLLIVRQHRRQLRRSTRLMPKVPSPIDVQHLLRFGLKRRAPSLQVVLELVWLYRLRPQNLGNPSSRQVLQIRMPCTIQCLRTYLANRRSSTAPAHSPTLRSLTGQGHHPGPRFGAQGPASTSSRQIWQRSAHAQFESLGQAALDPAGSSAGTRAEERSSR
jgi:hypothetical protein